MQFEQSPGNKRQRVGEKQNDVSCSLSADGTSDTGISNSLQDNVTDDRTAGDFGNLKASEASVGPSSPQPVSDADVQTRSKVITLLGQSLQDPTPLFDVAYSVEVC